MKIYEIGTGYTPIPAQMGAATEIVVEELTKAFLALGAPVEIIDIAAEQRPDNNLPIREIKVPKCFAGTDVKLGIMHKLKRVVYSVALAKALCKILKQSEEKVILHFHNQYNLYFFLKLVPTKVRKKARIVYTVHSYVWPGEWDEIKETVKKRYFQEIYCVRNADCVFVLNDKTKEHFVRRLGVRGERIHKIGNGVNTDVYRTLDKVEIDSFQASIGLSGKKVILQVGSVCDRKNQLGAVQLLCDYLQKHPETVYVYAGGVIDSEYFDSINRYAEENGLSEQIKYVGELCPGETLNKYYNIADITLFPSKIESFGLVILESISAETPVVLAEKPMFSLNEGYYVYQSSEELISVIENCLVASKETGNSHIEIVDNFGWQNIARDYLLVLANRSL